MKIACAIIALASVSAGGCGARVSLDSTSGEVSACCVEGLDNTGDPCGAGDVGVCRDHPPLCFQWCTNPDTGACEPKVMEAPLCGSWCPNSGCDPQG